MAFRTQKISQMTPKGANLEATDLIEVSTIESGSYVTRSITGQEIIDAAVGNVDWGDIGGTLSAQTDLQNALDAKVPTSRTLTINGVTQDLSADRTFTISTGITIGSTAIASGTVGRILFEGAGNVVQESSSLFWDNTNSRLGIGTATPSALLHTVGSVTASGAIARGNYMQPTLVASANSDVLTALHINPTYTLGAFTGIDRYGLLIQGDLGSSAIGNSGNHLRLNGTNNANSTRFLMTNNFNSLMVFTCVGASDTSFNTVFRGKNVLVAPSGLMITSNNAGAITPTDVALTIFQNKNVAIDTTTDAGYKLDVNGTARVQGALTLSAASPSITLGGDLTITSTLYPSRVASFDILNSNLNLIANGFGEGMFIGNRLTVSRTSTTFVSPDGLNAVGSAKITAYDGNGNINIQASNNGNRSIVLRGLGASGAVLIGNITTGNGTSYSAILQADSTTQGFLPPRMTTTQKNAIASPAAGLMVYDTTLNVISYYNGTMWI